MPHILFRDSSEGWGGLQHWMHCVSEGLRGRGWTTELVTDRRDSATPKPNIIVVGRGSDIRAMARQNVFQKTPIVWSVGGAPKFSWFQNLSRDRLTDYALVPSQYLRGLFVEAGWKENRVTAIPYGIAAPRLTPDAVKGARSYLGWRDDELVILFVGALRRVKRIDDLIDAYDRIRLTHPRSRLVIVGTGIKHKELEAQAARLGLSDHVVFTGFQRDTSPYFIGCDLLALPSREETFGMVLLEAMVRRKPIIASSSGAIPEVVGEGDAALLYESGDVEGLAHAIQRLADDPPLRTQLGMAGEKRANELFSEELMLDRLDTYFRSVLQ